MAQHPLLPPLLIPLLVTLHFALLILLFLLVRGQEAWLWGGTRTVCFHLFNPAILSAVPTTKIFDGCFHCVVRFPFDA